MQITKAQNSSTVAFSSAQNLACTCAVYKVNSSVAAFFVLNLTTGLVSIVSSV